MASSFESFVSWSWALAPKVSAFSLVARATVRGAVSSRQAPELKALPEFAIMDPRAATTTPSGRVSHGGTVLCAAAGRRRARRCVTGDRLPDAQRPRVRRAGRAARARHGLGRRAGLPAQPARQGAGHCHVDE